MTSGDLNNRAYRGYGAGSGAGAGGMYAPYSNQNRDDNHLGSTEYHDITSGLGNADTHIYYVF